MSEDRARALLADPVWRRRKGRWRLWIWLSFGILGFIPLTQMALKTRERKYIVLASVQSLAFVAYMLTSSMQLWTDNILIPLLLSNIVLSFTLHKPWLRWLAANEPTIASKEWWKEGVETPGAGVSISDQAHQDEDGPFKGVSDDLLAPPPPISSGRTLPPPPPPPPSNASQGRQTTSPLQVCDVNLSDASTMIRALGLDPSRASLVVETRRRGPFRNFDDFARAAGLQPHEQVRLRDFVVISDSGDSNGGGGRILDI